MRNGGVRSDLPRRALVAEGGEHGCGRPVSDNWASHLGEKGREGEGGIKRLKRWVWGMRPSMAALYTCFLNEVGNCAAQLGIMWICIVTFTSGCLRCETYKQPGSEKGQWQGRETK